MSYQQQAPFNYSYESGQGSSQRSPTQGQGQGYDPYQAKDPPEAGFNIPPDNQYLHPGNGTSENFEFSDSTIRRGFIRKVYSILMVQLLITVGFIALFLYNESAQKYTATHPGLFITAMIITFIMIFALACCENIRRKFPHNLICLGVFTVAEGFLLGTAASTYNENSVILAVGITTVVCLGLTLFSMQTKWDFTGMGGYLFVFLLVFVLFSFIAIFLRSTFPVLNTLIASCGALLFSFYLVYDTQLMLGGNHKYSISPEEYISASLNLYLDIINLFIYILQIIGSKD